MSKEKITLDMQVTPFQFRQYTFEMLKAKEEFEYIHSDHEALPKSFYVEDNYVVTENQEKFKERFSREISDRASEKARRIGLIWQTLLFAAYILFYCIYWNKAGRLIDDGWFLFVPFAFLVIVRYAENLVIKLGATAIRVMVVVFLILGAVFPWISLVKAGEASPAKGRFITVSIIVYFACIISAIVFYWLIRLLTRGPIEKSLRNNPKIVERYNRELEEAAQIDEAAAEELRRRDEKAYQDYIQDHIRDHADMMARKEEIEAEWVRYEELYKAWCGSTDMVEFAYDLPKGRYTNDELIKRGAEMVSRYVTGTHTIMEIFGKQLVDVACDLMKKNMM